MNDSLEKIARALRLIERHHIALNARSGRPPDESFTISCAREGLVELERLKAAGPRVTKLYIDCEWDGFGGKLLSIALVGDGVEFYREFQFFYIRDPWVRQNAVPKLGQVTKDRRDEIQRDLHEFLMHFESVHIVADWPEDIERFCGLLITGPGRRIDTPPLTMEVVRIDLVSENSHHALADARALMKAMRNLEKGL